MALPQPTPGLVINYSYVWAIEARQGQEEGLKDRPCLVVLAVESRGGPLIVTLAPISHTPPKDPTHAVEIPIQTKQRLGMDGQRSWIVTTEVNSFVWPGPDIRPLSRARPGDFVYGMLPQALFRRVRDQLLEQARLMITRR